MSECFECGENAEFDHHVVPRSLGGTKTISLCEICHGKVHDHHFTKMSTLTSMALQKLKASGKKAGFTPYGYSILPDNTRVDNTQEQIFIRQMQGWRAEGLSYHSIADKLNGSNVPSKTGGKWWSMTVRSILNNSLNRRSELQIAV